MLSDEDKLLHTVSVNVVPITKNVRVLFYELLELISRHSGVPLSCVAQIHLLTSLLENVAYVLLVSEVAHTFCSDNALRPASSYELVKACDVHWTSSYIDVSSDAVFLSLTSFLIVVMVMATGTLATMMVLAVLIVLVLMLIMLVLVMMVMMFTMFMTAVIMIMFMIVNIVVVFFLLHFIKMFLYLTYPGSRSNRLVEVKHISVENLREFHVAVVALNDLRLRL